MNVGFLFNSDHAALGGCYGLAVMGKMIEINVLQHENRHMRVSVGDILTYGRIKDIDALKNVYTPATYDRLKRTSLEQTFNRATVYCWFFKNITSQIADKVHNALFNEDYYLGAMDIDYLKPPQVVLFDCSLIEKYRFQGKKVSFFYSMGDDEDPQVWDEKSFSDAGFEVDREDTGARKTIFDDYYDSIEHHKRTYYFSEYFINELGWNEINISNLIFNLEELHPYLFNILYSCCITLRIAEVKEQLSQSHLSGRRFVEHLADFLFPPRETPFSCQDGNERDVGSDKYINRLGAYIEETMLAKGTFDAKDLERHGKRIDKIYKSFCRGVHKPFSDEKGFSEELTKTNDAVSELGVWIFDVIEIDPSAVRRPYLAYTNNMVDLLRDL